MCYATVHYDMGLATEVQMLDADDLGPADEKLLDLLRDGRVTAPFAADETGYSLQYCRDRLGRLVEHGNAKKVYEGLYELVEDPREDADTDTVDVPDAGYDEVRLFVEDGVWIAHHPDTDTEASGATKVNALRAIIKTFADQDSI